VDQGTVVPQRCVSEFQGRFSVLAVADSNKIVRKPVQILSTFRDMYLIGEGVEKGELVVFEGLQKAKEGSVIVPEVIDYQSQYVENSARP
jgi:membrane fusion protein (multidrug efflux system)